MHACNKCIFLCNTRFYTNVDTSMHALTAHARAGKLLKKDAANLFEGMEFAVEERACGEDGGIKRVAVLRAVPPPRTHVRAET